MSINTSAGPAGPTYNFQRPDFPKADVTIVRWQRMFAVIVLALLLLCAAMNYYKTELLVLNALVTVFYVVFCSYRVLLIDLSLKRRGEMEIPAEQQTPPPDGWPEYLILVPLHRESEILPSLVSNLRALDYPSEKLDVRLLIEADDEETLSAARCMNLQAPFSIKVIPESYPQTKPKACNVGLEDSTAKYCVIYDAEDRPDADQLKKAVCAFERVSDEVACVQAKLNFYNPDQNVLTKWFSGEYAMWFDMCLPGLDALQAPIPLGGTSNHFRMSVLRDVGAWDEFNVTEDCDLGLRLFASGWRTRIIDSTTWEQACPSVPNWIRQRSRWTKGFVQTFLVHMRHPFRQVRNLGALNTAHFILLIGGTPFCQLVNPFYWAMAILWFVFRPEVLSVFFPGPVFAMAVLCLFVGNFTFAYAGAVACVRRGLGRLSLHGLAMPLYWALMSYAAWKGTLQLIRKPHYWEKTRHFAVQKETA